MYNELYLCNTIDAYKKTFSGRTDIPLLVDRLKVALIKKEEPNYIKFGKVFETYKDFSHSICDKTTGTLKSLSTADFIIEELDLHADEDGDIRGMSLYISFISEEKYERFKPILRSLQMHMQVLVDSTYLIFGLVLRK
jgi:hypothetical protein